MIGDTVKPRTKRLTFADRGGLANENEERRLKGIVRGVGVAQHLTADVQHHRGMTPQQ
jgi:hypothetical protein